LAVVEGVSFILGIGILAVSALLFSTLFARAGLSIIPAQILAGMVVGPSILGLVTDTTVLSDISTIGIVLLLFIIGLELDPVELSKLARKVTLFTSIEVGVAFGFGLVASYLLGFTFEQAMILSMASSITSTAIVGKGILERRSFRSTSSRYLIGLLIVEDIAAVVFLILLSSIASTNQGILEFITGSGSGFGGRGISAIAEVILGGIALLGMGLFVARYVAPPVINYLSTFEDEFEEIPFLFALGLGFLFAVLAAYLGYSPGIGAFIIGLTIRGKQSKFLARKILPVKDLFLVLFFVSMGSLINPIPSLELGIPLVAAMLLLIVGKFAGGYVVGAVIGSEKGISAEAKTSMRPAVLGTRLIPRGEFSLVIGQLGLSLGLIDNQFFSIIGLTVFITALAATVMQRFIEPKRAASIHPFKGEQDVQ
jgi:CPA2 family monovalent cation:H+ antiporter-2